MKLRQYNQIILAIGGTLAVLMLVVGAFISVQDFMFRPDYDLDYEPGIVSEQAADSLIARKVRQQLLTFRSIELLDTLRGIYLLPISQRNLAEEESINGMVGLSNFSGRPSGRYKSGIQYNNLVLYNSSLNNSIVVFDRRISISSYQYVSRHEQSALLIRAAEVDSNQDKYIDAYDLQKLYIYHLQTERLQQVLTDGLLSYTGTTIRLINGELVTQFGVDRNGNGEFEETYEPKFYYKIDLQNGQIAPLVSEQQIRQIQKLLEGSR